MSLKKFFLIFLLIGLMIPIRGQSFDKYINPTVFVDITHAAKLSRRPSRIQINTSGQPDFDRKFVLAMDRFLKKRDELGPPITVFLATEINKDKDTQDKTSRENISSLSEKPTSLSVSLDLDPNAISVSEDITLGSKLNESASVFDKLKRLLNRNQSVKGKKPSTPVLFFHLRLTDVGSGEILLNQEYNSLLDVSVFRNSTAKLLSSITENQIEILAEKVISLLMGWTERQSFLYYDDRDYGMFLSYKLISVGDFVGAKSQAYLNLVESEQLPGISPKDIAKLHYNLAVTLLSNQEFAKAVEHLRESVRLDPYSEIYIQALEKGIYYEKYARQ